MLDLEELQDSGRALLAKCRHLLLGIEMEACEWAASDDLESDLSDFWGYSTVDIEDLTEDELEEHEFTSERVGDMIVYSKVITRLRHQFCREITEWIDARDRSASRRSVETHNRLHPLTPSLFAA